MARLVYSAITSLDGYVANKSGKFDWAEPNQEVHAFVNELERPIGTYLYGRRMYEVMTYWATAPTEGDRASVELEFATIWQAADKIVYSHSMDAVVTDRTRLERNFDPSAVRALTESSDRDISVGGPTLAAEAIKAGLVDEITLLLNPVVVGGGTSALPDDVRVRLELLDEHRFGNGVIYLRYGVQH